MRVRRVHMNFDLTLHGENVGEVLHLAPRITSDVAVYRGPKPMHYSVWENLCLPCRLSPARGADAIAQELRNIPTYQA